MFEQKSQFQDERVQTYPHVAQEDVLEPHGLKVGVVTLILNSLFFKHIYPTFYL